MSRRVALTVQTSMVLVALARSETPRYSYDMQRELPFVDMTSMSDLTKRLVRDGYAEWTDGPQHENPNVPERKYIRLTPAGEAQAEIARRRLEEFAVALELLDVRPSRQP